MRVLCQLWLVKASVKTSDECIKRKLCLHISRTRALITASPIITDYFKHIKSKLKIFLKFSCHESESSLLALIVQWTIKLRVWIKDYRQWWWKGLILLSSFFCSTACHSSPPVYRNLWRATFVLKNIQMWSDPQIKISLIFYQLLRRQSLPSILVTSTGLARPASRWEVFWLGTRTVWVLTLICLKLAATCR